MKYGLLSWLGILFLFRNWFESSNWTFLTWQEDDKKKKQVCGGKKSGRSSSPLTEHITVRNKNAIQYRWRGNEWHEHVTVLKIAKKEKF